jgi:hypothetical protein
MVAQTGIKTDRYYVDELIQDAVADTVSGVIHWDPERVTLERHLLDAIRSRSRHHYVRGLRFRRYSLDELQASDRVEVEQTLLDQADADAERLARARHAHETLTALKELTQDRELLLLIDAFEAGNYTQPDVLASTELTLAQFRAARKRLRTLVARLPNHLGRRSQ